jgi:hypothetical protein
MRSLNFPGHVKDREQLMNEAKLTVDDSTITSHIKANRFFCCDFFAFDKEYYAAILE